MAWSDAARKASLEARKRNREMRTESRYYRLERWYDRHAKDWVATPHFKKSGNPSSLASIRAHQKKTIMSTGLGHFYLARELLNLKGGSSDPRGGRFVPKKSFSLKMRKKTWA